MLKTVAVPEKLEPLFAEAQRYVQQYFDHLQLSPERGTVEVAGQRYVLVRAASLSVEFYEMVKRLYRDDAEATAVAQALLFDVAHSMGIADASAFSQRMNLTDPIARLSAGPIHFAHAGWAFVDISAESAPAPDDSFYLLYDHPYSFESDAWLSASKPSQSPVCVMNAGYSSGWCEHSFSQALVATEILCRGKGDAVCRFIMAPPQRMNERIGAYAQAHPELAPRINRYFVPSFFGARTDPDLLRRNLELEQRAQQKAQELEAINRTLQADIAQRKKTELALGASTELNERLFEALPGGVLQVGVDGVFLRANSEALRVLGVGPEALHTRSIYDYESQTILEDGSPARVPDYPVTRALATGQPQPPMTIGTRKPDGELSWAVYRAVPTRDPETQSVNGAVVMFVDITERKRFEDKVRHTQKLESLGVLAGGVAHDFNNLLVAILGNASIARGMPECDPKIAALLQDVELGARRAAELTKQMLDYAGQGRSEMRRVELPSLIREMSKLLHALIPKNVELRHHIQEGVPPIDGDPTQLRQVIMNLITNAAEAMGGRSGRVVVSVEHRYLSAQDLEKFVANSAAPGRFVVIEVSDQGVGMSPETVSRMFDPFFTTKFQGRGLGMAAVLGIVSGHRGAIVVETRPDHGTTVGVALPTDRHTPHGMESPVVSGDRAVLVIDDDDAVRNVTEKMLMQEGYRVMTASNAIDGLELFARHATSIALVVMDVAMPKLNGLDALRRLRATGSRVPVLLCSGYLLDASETIAAGATETLLKPYDVPQLLEAVERALGRQPS